MKKLIDIAKVIRSKNSSPFELTLDIILKEYDDYQKIKTARCITRERIAASYNLPIDLVGEVIYFDPAKAIKIGLKRTVSSGAPGDTDVYGAQQHAPLLTLELEIE